MTFVNNVCSFDYNGQSCLEIAADVTKFFENCPNSHHLYFKYFSQNPAFILAGFQ